MRRFRAESGAPRRFALRGHAIGRLLRVRRGSRAFTLIELLVAISLSTIVLGAVYFSLSAGLDSWRYTHDELALQHVMTRLLARVLEGDDWSPGVRSSLEITQAWDTQMSFVEPWGEEHLVSVPRQSFQLQQYVKPGAGMPAAEVRLPGEEGFQPAPIRWADNDQFSERPRIEPIEDLVPGSSLYLTYYPDPDRSTEATITLRCDAHAGALFLEKMGHMEELSKNLHGVKIRDCRFRYYDSHSRSLSGDPRPHDFSKPSEPGDVPTDHMPLITAVEVELTGAIEQHTFTVVGMAMLRNSSRQSGVLILREDMDLPVPDSAHIRTFLLTNLSGITNEDEIELELAPKVGRAYRIHVRFERFGTLPPVIGQVTVESPPGELLYTDRPRIPASQGLDVLTIGPNGLFDYDDDPDVEDVVQLEGEVTLAVRRLDIEGAAAIIRP